MPAAPFEGLLKHYLKELGLPRAGLFLLLCGDLESRRLNWNYRAKDESTDILSFPAQTGSLKKPFAGYLGDLALNLPYAWRKRGRFAGDFAGDLAFLLLHGLLHLTGIHHDSPAEERRMEALMRRHFPPPARLLAGLEKMKINRSWSR